MNNFDEIKEGLVRKGIPVVETIDPKSIHVANWVRLKCQYGCGGFGKFLTCPPYSPTPEETRKILSEYSTAILLQIPEIEPDVKSKIWRKFKKTAVDLEVR